MSWGRGCTLPRLPLPSLGNPLPASTCLFICFEGKWILIDSDQTECKKWQVYKTVLLRCVSFTCSQVSEENHGRPLTFIINSVGGNVNTMMTIIGLINIAKLSDIPVITFVLGLAASAASMIAVQGDERYINKISRHFIHFGCIWDITTKHTEIEKMYLQNKQYSESMIDLYLEACGGKLSREKLLSLQSDERGYLNAEECVKYGLCDAIIEDDLDIRKKEQEELDKHYGEFEEYMKQKQNKKS